MSLHGPGTIVYPETIDGTTQPGYSGIPLIELDGSNAGAGALGLLLTGGNSAVYALAINRFDGSGIGVDTYGYNTIARNYIGTDRTGATAQPNGQHGVAVGSAYNTIGGVGAGNLISGNDGVGVYLLGQSAHHNEIEGNVIGLNAAITDELGNGLYGVVIQNGGQNTVGGTSAGMGNVISGNGDAGLPNPGVGVYILGVWAADNLVQRNAIGTDIDGSDALGNKTYGVVINNASDNFVLSNAIAHNGDVGVLVVAGLGAATGNRIRSNGIWENGGLGIDLGADGVTANDAGDGDSGPNGLQNYPVLTSAESDGVSTTVAGTLNSAASMTYTIEFFAVPQADASGYGEGKTSLGQTQVTTDGGGDASFDVTLSAGAPGGSFVTATATDPNGNTSEFSAAVAAALAHTYSWHYEYDDLYRLTYACADWDEGSSTCLGDYWGYTYDGVGNRLTQVAQGGTNNYVYDDANRLTGVDGVTYTWDDKGNLLDDGTRTYTYDHANRSVSLVQGADTYTFAYNGLGDRLSQTVNAATTEYTLDLEVGLTQVLVDGTNTYLYGVGRIGESTASGVAYHLPAALGTVRQLSTAGSEVAMAQSFAPFGGVLQKTGSAATSYGFTGEWTDATDLIHLRARYLDPIVGRFISRDTWLGSKNTLSPQWGGYGADTRRFVTDDWPSDYSRPQSLNRWVYAGDDPVNRIDPSGHISIHFQVVVRYAYRYGFLPEYTIPSTVPPTPPRWPGQRRGKHVDLADVANYAIYEVEPYVASGTYPAGHGPDQVKEYLDLLNNANGGIGTRFVNQWKPGGRVGDENFTTYGGLMDVHAWWDQPGLIVYQARWNEERVRVALTDICYVLFLISIGKAIAENPPQGAPQPEDAFGLEGLDELEKFLEGYNTTPEPFYCSDWLPTPVPFLVPIGP